ncbi:hypothetical protein ACWF0M_26300 [Kribbella sp. NPDC055110]
MTIVSLIRWTLSVAGAAAPEQACLLSDGGEEIISGYPGTLDCVDCDYEHDAGIGAQTAEALSELGTSLNLEPRQWQILTVAD